MESQPISTQLPTTQPPSITWFGKWDGRYQDCSKILQKNIQQQIIHRVWLKKDFVGVDITSDIQLREEITKVYMAWYMATKKTYRVKWSGSFIELMKSKKEDKKVIAEVLLKKWETQDGLLDSDLPNDFSSIHSIPSCPYATIHSTEKNNPSILLAFQIPVPTTFISQLQNSHSILPKHQSVYQQGGIHDSRHYTLWGDYSWTPYMSKEFLKDGAAATNWIQDNKALFQYLADELKLRDPATYGKMNGTLWLDNIIQHNGVHLGQNVKKTKKQKEKQKEEGNEWEDEEEVKLEKVSGLWHGLAINEAQSQSGKPHKDYADAKEAYNCVIPCGDWRGGEVILCDLTKKVELKEGQALFFQGRIIMHNAWRIEGSRNSVDLFIHESLLKID